MKRKTIIAAAALAAFAGLSGCGSTGVFDRERPDEFAVTREAPLQIPRDYTLPAPAPASESGLSADTKQEVLDALFSNAKPGN